MSTMERNFISSSPVTGRSVAVVALAIAKAAATVKMINRKVSTVYIICGARASALLRKRGSHEPRAYLSRVNYLAHLFLAGDSAESLIGNLAGDFVKGPIRGSDAISEGIRQHRRVDAFTDTHPSVAAFRRVLIPEHGHYARVISDVFFDHFLATRWSTYTDEDFEAFLR